MTLTRFVEWMLATNWTEERPGDGRVKPVPEPRILRENKQRKKRGRTRENIVIKDGGVSSYEPASFNWAEENADHRVSVDCRAKDRKDGETRVDGYERLFGYRNTGDVTDAHGLAPGEKESWGGVTGEIRRILAGVRDGQSEFDLVNAFEVSDISNQMGRGNYRSVVEIRLTEYAVDLSGVTAP